MPEFGYHTIGTSNLDFGAVAFGCKFSLLETGTPSKMGFYGKPASGSVNVKGAIYSVSGGAPSAKLEESSGTLVSTSLQWWDLIISGASSRSAGDYVLMLLPDADLTVYYLQNAGLGDIYTQESATYPTFPDPSSGSFVWDSELSVFCEYSTGGGGKVIPVFMYNRRQQ